MEADTLFDFTPSTPDELKFKKGVVVKVLDIESDPNWFLAEHNGRTGLVPNNYIKLKPNPWYVKECDRDRAQSLLLAKINDQSFRHPDGAFIVRKSLTSQGFSLSVKAKAEVLSFKVLSQNLGEYKVWDKVFSSLNELIAFHQKHTISSSGDLLLKAVSFDAPTGPPLVTALFPFQATQPDELSFHKGDKIEVIGQEDDNWLRGRIGDRVGYFPQNYVQTGN